MKSLLAKMLLMLIPTATIPLAFFGFFSLQKLYQQSNAQSFARYESIINTSTTNLKDILALSQQGLIGASSSGALRANNQFLARQTLAGLLSVSPQFSRLTLVNTDNTVVTSEPPNPMADGKPLQFTVWNQLDGIAVTPIYLDAEGRYLLAAMRNVENLEGQLVAKIVAEVDLTPWLTLNKSLIANLKGVQAGVIFDPRGRQIIDFSRNSGDETLFLLAEQALQHQGRTELTLAGSEDYLLSTARLSELDAVIFFAQPSKVIYGGARDLVMGYALLLFVIIFSLGVGLYLIAKSITRPIAAISEAAAAFSAGNLESRVASTTQDEVGQLAATFNAMGAAIRESQAQLVRQTVISAELEAAENLQRALLSKPLIHNKKIHVTTHFRAADRLGGDWYWFLETPTHFYALIGDVTGHGIAPGILSALIQGSLSALNWQVQQGAKNLTPAQIIQMLQQIIEPISRGGLSMTALALCINTSNGEMSVYNANHTFPILVDSGVKAITTRNGGVATILKPGDRIILYTDGLSEARDTSGAPFLRRLPRLLRASAKDPADALKDAVIKRFEAHVAGSAQADDMCLIVMEYRKVA
jgi:serine phosphatase RsbU (regulator of sigma subunit)